MGRGVLIIAAIGAGLAALLGAGAAASAVAPTAAAPCWRLLVDDVYDGRIGSSYQLQCYRTAVDHIPCNAVYHALCQDLEQAMASGVARLEDRGTAVDSATVIPAPSAVVAPKRHDAIPPALVARLAASAVLVGLLVAWIIVRVRRPSRR